MSWSPNVADLPVTGEKPISSQKWKNVVYDIYNKLNIIRLLNTGVAEPVDAETGMPWVDTANGITLKLYNALDLQWHALAFYSDLLASNVVVTPSGNLSASDVQAAVIELQADIDTRLLSSDVVTEATANKVLRLNADSKLPASITGDADTVDGKHADYFALSSDVATKATANKVLRLNADSKLPASITGDADTVDGKHASDLVLVSDIVTEAVANKILKLNADSKLPASITGDADTVDGKHASAFQEVAEKDQPGGYAGLDNNGALNSKIRSTYISDFNTATIGGLYYWGSSTLNVPVPGSGGTALVIDRLTNAGLTQIAIVTPARILYIRVSTNTSNTEWTDWEKIDAATWGRISGTLSNQTDLQAALDGKVDTSPSMTGSATLNGSTDNTVQLTGIVTTLFLEVGDVIRIQYSGYDKLHTVESITDDNSIIVNYEHAGNRGNGSLKLADKTATVTITRIAKWYNAPIGLGQEWVKLLGVRVGNTNYTNATNRTITVFAELGSTAVQNASIIVDGIKTSYSSFEASNGWAGATALVNAGAVYKSYASSGTQTFREWAELR